MEAVGLEPLVEVAFEMPLAPGGKFCRASSKAAKSFPSPGADLREEPFAEKPNDLI